MITVSAARAGHADGPARSPLALQPDGDRASDAGTREGAALSRSLAVRAAERPSVLDYGVKGGGTITAALQPQTRGDHALLVPNTLAVVAGNFVTSPDLPAGTTILRLGKRLEFSPAFPIREPTAPLSPQSLGTALGFAVVFAVPIGAVVSGAGIPAGTTVTGVTVSAHAAMIYISKPTPTGIAAGTAVTFTYSAVPVTLSAGWLHDISAGDAIGITANDDGPAFQRAFNRANAHDGGPGTIFIPSGSYYASTSPGIADGVAVETAANVALLPGTTPIGDLHGFGSGYAAHTIASTGQSLEATTLNLNQSIFQQTTPTAQIQGEMISQHNVGCINDGGPWGCGMVGEDIQQAMDPGITEGVIWGYHVTDFEFRGQRMGWAGAEIELNNQSGNDQPQAGTFDVSEALHLDNIGNTPTTVGLYFGGSVSTNGYWHDAINCPDNAISDACIRVSTGANGDTLAGIDMTGSLSGQSLSIGPTASSAGSAPGAFIDREGNTGLLSLDTQTITTRTASVRSVSVLDGGIFDAAPKLSIQAPPANGKPAAVAAATYSLRTIVSWRPLNRPVGVQPGDVYTIPGGRCSVQPTVGYYGGNWQIANPGSCSAPPWGTAGKPASTTGGHAAPEPQFELGYQITSITVTRAGAGYNATIAPQIYAARANDDLGAYHVKTTVQLGAVLAAPLTMTNSGLLENGAFQALGSIVTSRPGPYTFTLRDCGTTVRGTSETSVIYTVPAGLPIGCLITVLQAGQGPITLAGTKGETLESLNSLSRTSGRFAKAVLEVDTANSVHASGQLR